MKVAVFGCKGQLGVALAETCPPDVELVGVDLPELDITDSASVVGLVRDHAPSCIVNAAAYTAVDQAEKEAELARAVNVSGPQNLAVAAREAGASLLHVSTDFVFDGQNSAPYHPGDPTDPINAYGRTKRDGEVAVLDELPDSAVVLRTAWLYSRSGSNFVKTMLRLMDERDSIRVVADQRGSPTWANSLAVAIWRLVGNPAAHGIFHWTDGGEATWHEFAVAIQEEALQLGLLSSAIPIEAISTSEYPTPARRPRYSVLDSTTTQAAIGLRPEPWRKNLREMLKGMGP